MEVAITARPPSALHCSDSQPVTIQEKHRRGWPEFFKAARLATAKQMTSCILKICKNELKHVDNKDNKTVNARAKAKVKAKAKLKD